MPTRKRTKNTIRNRKTRRSMRTMRPTRPMRPMKPLNSTKHLSIPLGYFGSIQINRRSDNNGFDFIFDLVKKIRGGAKLSNSQLSINLIRDVMNAITKQNISIKILNDPTLANDPNFNLTNHQQYSIMTTNSDNTIIKFYNPGNITRNSVPHPLHISMYQTNYNNNFPLQPTRKLAGKYHISYGNDHSGSTNIHFPLEWHIDYDTDHKNFYLRCEYFIQNNARPPPQDMINAIKAIVDIINEVLKENDNRISAIDHHRVDINRNIANAMNDNSTSHTINSYYDARLFPNNNDGRRVYNDFLYARVKTATNEYDRLVAQQEEEERRAEAQREEEERLVVEQRQIELNKELNEELDYLQEDQERLQGIIDRETPLIGNEDYLATLDKSWEYSPTTTISNTITRMEENQTKIDKIKSELKNKYIAKPAI